MTDEKRPPVPPVVLIGWRDAMTATSGWATLERIRETSRDAFDNPIRAAGFLIYEDDDLVVVAVAWNPDTEEPEVTGAMMIPRSEVVSIDVLREAET